MFSQLFKTAVRKSLGVFGVEIHRRGTRSSLVDVLQQAKRAGLSAATVIDVGAALGAFAIDCYTVFPSARYVLIEPLEENRSSLEAVTRIISQAEFILAVATAQPGDITINVHPDLDGSSLYREGEDSNVDGVPRTVPAVTLDRVVQDGRLEPPFLIKADVQGAELDVLRGAERTLPLAHGIVLEVSLFEFFQGGPQFYDVVAFMKSKGFVVYDIFSIQYRPLDRALSQVDILFVQEHGVLRQHHFYATRAQREEQNRRLQSEREARGKSIG